MEPILNTFTKALIRIKTHPVSIIYVLTFLAVVVAPVYTTSVRIFFHGYGYDDFHILMKAGMRIFQGELIYNAQEMASDVPYLYAPFSAYLMGIYHVLFPDGAWARLVWTLLSYLAFGGTLKLCANIMREIFQEKLPWFFYPVVIFLCFRYFLSNLQNGQVNAFLAFFMALSLYCLFYEKNFWAGAVLAFASLIKLPLLIFLLFFIFLKKWRALGAFVITTFVLLLLPALHLGWNENIFYLQQWQEALHTKSQAIFTYFKNYSNQSLVCFYGRLIELLWPNLEYKKFYFYTYAVSILTAIPMILGSFYIYLTRVKSSGIKFFGLASCLLVLMVILSPAAWKATFMHLLLPYSFILMFWWKFEKSSCFIPLLLILSFGFSSLINKEIFLGMGGDLNILIHKLSFIFFSAVIVFAGLWVLPFRKQNL